MSPTDWEADKMLDVYIHDYLIKRKLHNSARAFQKETNVSTDPVAIDAPGGFLFEWWSVFWDIFITRTNKEHSEAAVSYIETQISKTREQQQKSQQEQQQMQHLLMLRQKQLKEQQYLQQHQPQRRDGSQLLNGNTNGLGNTDSLMRQNSGAAAAERLKLPLQRDPSNDPAMKQRFGDNMGHILDMNQATISALVGGQSPGQPLHGAPGGSSGNLQQFQRSQQLLLPGQDMKSEMNAMMYARVAAENSLMRVPGSDPISSGSIQGGNNLTLNGRPLTPYQIRPGLLHQQKPILQTPQQAPLQLQEQLLLQAQQNMASPSTMDHTRQARMLFNSPYMGLGKDIPMSRVGDLPNVGSPVQVNSPVLPRSDTDMITKNTNQQQQHSPQNPMMNQQSPIVNQPSQPVGTGSMNMDNNMSNSFRGNNQASKAQHGRKRKQPGSSSGPANSSGTANTTGPSPGSAPSTPSTHTPGHVISMSSQNNGVSSKPSLMFGSDSVGALTSAPSQLGDTGRFVDDTTYDNVDSFLSPEEGDSREALGRGDDVGKAFSFKELATIPASTSKVDCCHFSSDGKILATGGHDKKALLWYTDSYKMKSTLDEHTSMITDVRFSPNMSRLATSSFDRSVRVWDADNPGFSLRNFTGHSSSVFSLDFHPNREDLICSCDGNGEIRYWSVTNGNCPKVFEGGMTQVRFQPRHGKYLAAAADAVVSVFDVETQARLQLLQGHAQKVHSVCWDASGEFLASVSEDLVKIWELNSGSKWQCIHELNCSGNKFHSCVFHPAYPSIIIIGCYQNLELWNMVENKQMTQPAHDGLVASLAASDTGLIASASHDTCVKLWM